MAKPALKPRPVRQETRTPEMQAFFKDLFGGTAPKRHGFRINPGGGPADLKILTHGSLEERAQMGKRMFLYEQECAEILQDDRIPTPQVWTGTEVFAAAFGCPVHRPSEGAPFALPLVQTASAADRLVEPDIFSGSLGAVFELADRLVELCGPEHPLRICDIQSPFDISALIWKKEFFFQALLDSPEAVHNLLRKVTATLIRFIRAFMERYPQACLVHFPELWMPVEMGLCLSEDDIGSISSRHFQVFVLPYLQQLAEEFGGISIHCCASAQHQWKHFLELPNIHYLNLFHPPTDLKTAIDMFSGKAVLVPGPHSRQGGEFHHHERYIDYVNDCLALSRPDTRFFFLYEAANMQEALETTLEFRQLFEKAGKEG